MSDRDPAEGQISGEITTQDVVDDERRRYTQEQTDTWRRNQARWRAQNPQGGTR